MLLTLCPGVRAPGRSRSCRAPAGSVARASVDETAGEGELEWLSAPQTQQRLSDCVGATEVLLVLASVAPSAGEKRPLLRPAAACLLLRSLVQLRKAPLALTLFETLRQPPLSSSPLTWAPLGAEGATALACALASARLLPEAQTVVQCLAWGTGASSADGAGAAARGGASTAAQLSFGLVVRCPHCAVRAEPGALPAALALVPPGEGLQAAACSACGFEFTVLSGTVASASSRALTGGGGAGGLLAPLWRLLSPTGSAGAAAVHELQVLPPSVSGTPPRQLRIATSGQEVPCGVGERVSLVSASAGGADGESGPASSAAAQRALRRRGALQRALLPARPVGADAGQWLELSNHASGAVTKLVPPPPPGAEGEAAGAVAGVPLLPLLGLLAAADGASSLLDPALPALLLAGVGVTAAMGAAARSQLLPALRRLPGEVLQLEASRQALLRQHAQLSAQAGSLSRGSSEDVVSLARLEQLDAKMGAVSGEGGAEAQGALYGARRLRVRAAIEGLQARLGARLALLERTARVASMVEIELELEGEGGTAASAQALQTLAPGGEGARGLGEEAQAMREAELLQEEWRSAAQAADAVERLLKAAE